MATQRFAYDDQVRSQPAAIRDVLARVEVPKLDAAHPVVFTGIGTSYHACRVAAEWVTELSGGRVRPWAVQAHELAIHGAIRAEDQVVVVSHRGVKRYPNAVLERAKAAGARTITITGMGDAEPDADVVLRTCPQETASTHTVSYSTALAVLGKLAATLSGPQAEAFADGLSRVPDAMEETLAMTGPGAVAELIEGLAPIFITGFGLDAITAAEAALKLKEGTYIWSEGMATEFALHGTPAVYAPGQAAIMIVPGRDDGGRTVVLDAVLRTIGVRTFTCGAPSDSVDAVDLPFASVDPLLRPFVSVLPLQRLVGEIARRVGSNPDTTHNEAEPWRSASDAVRL